MFDKFYLSAVMQSVDIAAANLTSTHTVYPLRPYSNYEFSVQAATIQDNIDMWGQLSQIVRSRTGIDGKSHDLITPSTVQHRHVGAAQSDCAQSHGNWW